MTMKRRHLSPREIWTGLRRIFLRFGPYLRKHRVLLAGSLLALFAEVGLRALEPWPLKFVFDSVLGTQHHGRISSSLRLEGIEPTVVLTLAALALVVITGLQGLVDYAGSIGFARVGNRVLTQVRSDLYRHLHDLSLSFHTKSKSGDLILRVMSDVNTVKDVLVTAAFPLLANLLLVFSMIVVMFWLHWKLALLALTTLPFFWFWTTRFTHRIRQAARTQRQKQAAMASNAAESISAIKVVQVFGLQELFAQSFVRRNLESQKEDIKTARLTAALGRTVIFLAATSSALVLWYGARLVLRKELTPGELLVFLAYLKTAFRPLRDLSRYAGRLSKATASGERVLDLLGQISEVRDLPGAVPAPAFRGTIRFEGVSFAYERGRPVLKHIDFEVAAGRHVAIAGPSGVGKSTLINLLLRLYDPQKGRVLIDSGDIREYTMASLRAQISVVFQDTILFGASVRDNIVYGALGADAEAVEAACRLANAHEFIQALPEGYDTILGERGVTLSGGQRQRLAIARAALRKAPILVLDEPATGLDEENESAVLEALTRLANGRTTFFITHDLRLAARADHVLYLEDGRVIERGSHEDLLQGRGRYASLYRQQWSTADRLDTNHTPAVGALNPAREFGHDSLP
jgi:ATP-binding cassette subfamily B protein